MKKLLTTVAARRRHRGHGRRLGPGPAGPRLRLGRRLLDRLPLRHPRGRELRPQDRQEGPQGRDPGHRRRHQAVLRRRRRRLPRHRQRLASDEEVRVRRLRRQGRAATSSRSRSASTASSWPPTRTAPDYNFKLEHLYLGLSPRPCCAAASSWPTPTRPGTRSAPACRATASWSMARRPPRAPATPSSNWPWRPAPASFPTVEDLRSDNEKRFKATGRHAPQGRRWIDAGENDNAIVQHPDPHARLAGRVRLLVPRGEPRQGEGRCRSTACADRRRPSPTAPIRCRARSTSM